MLEKYQKLNSNEILQFQVHRSGSPHSAFTNVLSELKSRKSSVDSNIKVGKIEQRKVSCIGINIKNPESGDKFWAGGLV